ncbi:VOC family protein OS=Cellulomonas persica OX=76861 GN=CPE01_11220 PE=4 SV=1 [Cellulomonas persica]|uniref:VOC family protein n=2 Tax=Cellulomonas persica TaxID=76861 RepID=A0A510US23_9CELL|nr:VOC family protein [Cellulomonas persica]
MAVVLNPYLGFAGRAREALEFYHAIFGGDLHLMTWGEGGLADDPARVDLIQHGQISAPDLTLMAADSGSPEQEQSGSSISVSLSGDDETRLRAYWDGLAEGATITEPLTQAPWGDTFGMLTDRFGTAWMVNISPARA